jgi:anti-sigma28 factor (negative regulator of flagellin synthesis)
MNQLSPENFGHAEPVSLRINIGQKSHEHNKAYRENYDNDNEIGLIDTDTSFEVEDMFVDAPEEITPEEHPASVIVKKTEIPQWDFQLESEDSSIEQNNETAEIAEAIEDGAYMISAEAVRQYGLQYEGGYMKFERDFQIKWVNPIQDPLHQEGMKKSAKNKMDAFMQFSHVSVEEFNNVIHLPDLEKEEYLAEHHIDADDFENWSMVLEFWENSDDLAFDEETLFGDVARGAFIAKLEKDKLEAI